MWNWLFPRRRPASPQAESKPRSEAGPQAGPEIGLKPAPVEPVTHGLTGEVAAGPAPASAPGAGAAQPVADAGAVAAAGAAFLLGVGLAHRADSHAAERDPADPGAHPGDAASADGNHSDAAHAAAAASTTPFADGHAHSDGPGSIDAGHGSPQDGGGGSPGW
ncbi:MAG: hypothetical protein P4L98_11480 [Ancalomicrobiaceae bacterium]|nr:hypothetical protein [Ancalomicrobiaceae bacterium]